MPGKAKPVPDGYHTVTTFLVADDADAVIAFMQKAFEAEFDHSPLRQPDGKLRHATLRVGDARVMISNSSERVKAIQAMLYVYVSNVDEVNAAAIKAGGAERHVLRRPLRRRHRSRRQSMVHRHAHRGRQRRGVAEACGRDV